jgi:phosphopantothenoylcysteine decarboxylase/phosphopantothenate--cysteine ligase
MTAEPTSSPQLNGYEVLLCLTGGIACYKSAGLASRLTQTGAVVHVAMTEAAGQFITPLTFQALTRQPVHTSLWQAAWTARPDHIALTERADLMVIAPASANIIAKIANGLGDDLVSTLALSAWEACPVLLAPAMNSRMWHNPATRANMKILHDREFQVVAPGSGNLACGDRGEGRMAEPAELFDRIVELLHTRPPKKPQ